MRSTDTTHRQHVITCDTCETFTIKFAFHDERARKIGGPYKLVMFGWHFSPDGDTCPKCYDSNAVKA
jgi:hypothetical protein